MTLDEWYTRWMDTCKKNCRNNTKETYAKHYKRVKEALGWRKLNKLNLVVMQDAINGLKTDNERRNSKKILVDMLEKAVAADLITKNVAKQITTELTHEEKSPRRVLSVKETEIFLKEAESTFYYNLFVVAFETGMRIQTIFNNGKEPMEGFENLVFVSRNNKPTTQFLVTECIEGIMKRIHKNNPDLVFEKITPT